MLQQKTGMHQRTAPSLLHFDILTTLAMALIKCHVEFYFLDETQVLFELHKAERGSERELDKVVYLSCTYSGRQRACFWANSIAYQIEHCYMTIIMTRHTCLNICWARERPLQRLSLKGTPPPLPAKTVPTDIHPYHSFILFTRPLPDGIAEYTKCNIFRRKHQSPVTWTFSPRFYKKVKLFKISFLKRQWEFTILIRIM